MIEAAIPFSRIDRLTQTGQPHLRAIYTAMRRGVGFALVRQRSGPFQPPFRQPFVAIVGDDTDRSLGPAGFHRKSIRRLAAMSQSVVLISCELIPCVYATAAGVALVGSSTLIVETRPEHEGAWLALIRATAPTASLLVCTVVAGSA